MLDEINHKHVGTLNLMSIVEFGQRNNLNTLLQDWYRDGDKECQSLRCRSSGDVQLQRSTDAQSETLLPKGYSSTSVAVHFCIGKN